MAGERRGVAPTLRALMADLRAKVRPGKAGAGDAQVLRVAESELRAFIALEAAVRMEERHPEWCEVYGAETRCNCRPKTTNALARLRRSGGAGRAG